MSYDNDSDPDDRTKISVVGITFCNDEDQVSRQKLLCGVYDDTDDDDDVWAELVAEPENPFDRHAVAVWIRRPDRHAGRVGFLPRSECPWVGRALAAGTLDPSVGVKLWCGGAGSNVGFAVFVDSPCAGQGAEEIEKVEHEDPDGEADDLGSMLAEYD